MNIRQATSADFEPIMSIYKNAQQFMIQSGNPTQWGTEYPSPALIQEDIDSGVSYVVVDESGAVRGVYALTEGPDITYQVIEEGEWLNEEPYVVIHRIASDASAKGIMRAVVDYCKNHYENIRIDTHADNQVMKKQILKNGFVKCGIIFVADGSSRIAYQWSKYL